MSNSLFLSGRQGFLDGSIDWDTDTIKVVFISRGAGGTNGYNALTDITFLTQIPDSGRLRMSETALGGKTVASGIADANDHTASAVSAVANSAIGAIVLYKDTGSPSTDRLIGWIDTGTGIPASPNGGDITIQWAAGTSKIFML